MGSVAVLVMGIAVKKQGKEGKRSTGTNLSLLQTTYLRDVLAITKATLKWGKPTRVTSVHGGITTKLSYKKKKAFLNS
jgi:hypothetical protein